MDKQGVKETMGIKCENFLCKFFCGGSCRFNGPVGIGSDGKCSSFKKGILFYFNLVWDVLKRKNFIDAVELDRDLRIGLYYVMAVFHLGFSEMEWGTCRMIMLKNGEGSSALKYEDIVALPVDEDVFWKLLNDFNAGKLPGADVVRKAPAKSSQPFGWLFPGGEFIAGDFGEHEAAARTIIEESGFLAEYREGSRRNGWTCRDFLSEVKGYCLIHNPLGSGGYVVSHQKPLTKKQRDFLYGYFMDLGDQFKAQSFVED